MINRAPSGRRQALARGIEALTKSLLLIAGVPVAGIRLWFFSSAQRYDRAAAIAIDVILIIVCALWVAAVIQLTTEIIRTIRNPEDQRHSSWSSSWAAGIVGMLLLVGGLAAHGSPIRHATPVVQAPSGAPHSSGSISSSNNARIVIDDVISGLGILVCAGVVSRIRLLARVRASFRDQGASAPPPDPQLRPLLRALHAEHDELAVDWIEAANRLLGRHFLGNGDLNVPEIALVRLGASGLELLLVAPLPDPPPGFVSSHDGWWWRIDPRMTFDEIRAIGEHSARFVPALIPIGTDGEGEILVALAGRRVLGVCGPEEEVDAVINAWLVALRVLPWCDEIAVEMIGTDPPPLEEQSAHMQRSSAETLEALQDRASTPRRLMGVTWRRDPLAVVHRRAFEDASADRIEAAARLSAAVLAGREGDVTLRIDGDHAVVEPYGIAIDRHLLATENQSSIDRLLAVYAQPLDVVPLDSPTNGRDIDPRGGLLPEIEIQILGKHVEIIGVIERAHRDDVGRVFELIVFIALNGHRARRAQILDELFVGGTIDNSRVRIENLVAIGRAMLGTTRLGTDRLRSEGDEIVLDHSVGLDWQRVRQEILEAQHTDGARALKKLSGALHGLDGRRLLAEATSYPWFRALRYDERVRSMLIDACHHLATLAQATGDLHLARRAIDLGFSIEPASEIVARDHMVYAESAGEPEDIERIYSQLQQTLHGLGGAEPSPITHKLYLSLLAGKARHR